MQRNNYPPVWPSGYCENSLVFCPWPHPDYFGHKGNSDRESRGQSVLFWQGKLGSISAILTGKVEVNECYSDRESRGQWVLFWQGKSRSMSAVLIRKVKVNECYSYRESQGQWVLFWQGKSWWFSTIRTQWEQFWLEKFRSISVILEINGVQFRLEKSGE